MGFNQKIYVYWSVMLERIESSNILRVLEENYEFASILKELHVDASDTSAVRELIHQTLYSPNGQH